MKIEKNNVLQITIDSLAYGCKGVGKINGLVVFVPYSVPGDVLQVKITKKKKNHCEAVIEKIVSPSALRVCSQCSLFSICGGCTSQNIAYENQIVFKEQILKSTLEHLAGIKNALFKPILPSPEIWNYRNKMELTFGQEEDGKVTLGFHKPQSYYHIVDVKKCYIQPKEFDVITGVIRDFANKRNLSVYDPKTFKGLLRHLILRKAKATGEIAAVLLTATKNLPDAETLTDEITAACPSVKGFAWGLNSGSADVARLDDILYQKGDLVITEKVGDVTYQVSPFSFFQTNTLAAEKLFDAVLEAAELSGKETLLDAYCGTGAIGIYCAKKAKRVLGIDINLESIWDARKNAKLNGLSSCTFLSGFIKKNINLLKSSAGSSGINRIILDPPRGGMDKKSLRTLLEIEAPLVVYVSCNPSVLARDLQLFFKAGYEIEYIQPLDMFPHTYHIESVVKLRHKIQEI